MTSCACNSQPQACQLYLQQLWKGWNEAKQRTETMAECWWSASIHDICWEFSVWPWCDFPLKLFKNPSIICKCVWIWASSCRRKATGESGDLQLNPRLQPSHWFLKCFSPAEKVKTKLILDCEFHLSESFWPWPWGMGMASKSSTCSADESAAAAVRQQIRLEICCKRIKTKRAKGDNAQDTAA